jgi:hypothetical protein
LGKNNGQNKVALIIFYFFLGLAWVAILTSDLNFASG